ncbi:MAG: gamma-glutamylcyclotransferase family protein [Acidobacteriota bacterium]
MIWYFAYGSNMKQSRLEERVKRKGLIWKVGFLENYHLCFNKVKGDGSGYANIEVKEGSKIWGVLYQLSNEEIKLLDKYEGVPDHYNRVSKEICTTEGSYNAEVYIANPDMIDDNLLPKRDYLGYLIDGATEHNLPKEYIIYLKSFKTFD